ncbi:MAG: polyamine aminopropyltransferase [Syntrophobacterales bacterium]|nr:MAG: polyamine aminopropyltransferase [Syntrophobacterales bacterium]
MAIEMDFWFTETVNDIVGNTIKVKERIFSGRSEYQEIEIVDTYHYGRTLILEGSVQLTEKDEFTYHEMISHIPLFTHPNPERVLVIGGGDGGTIREVMKHPTVIQAQLAEIDPLVIEKSKQFLPFVSCELENPRVEIIIQDGMQYVKHHKGIFDVVLIDSPDPVGPAVGLYQKEFFEDVHKALKDDGIMVGQSESPFFDQTIVRPLYTILKPLFPIRKMYLAPVPSYPSGLWSFVFCSKRYDPILHYRLEDFHRLNLKTRYYNEAIHQAAFALPNFIQELIA